MAVLGSGAPRILWSSTGDIKNCKYGQALLGYIWRNSDPSGSPQPFWRESRKNFLRFHAWKWTQVVAMTKDHDDYHKAFSVYEDRATGKFTLNLCPGTESHKPAAAIAAAQKECVATFTKDTNPVRSDKNVRGFFVSGTQFIFSKHEETGDGDEMFNGEVPAYGALGRWILQTLPKEDTDAKIKGSLAASNGDIFKKEGLFQPKQVQFWIASHVDDMMTGKRVEVVMQRARGLGHAEWVMMTRHDYWLARSEGPFVPVPRTAGAIFVEDKNEWYPLALNNPETDLSQRPAITALGSLLADKRLHGNGNKPRNLFAKCKPQTNFDGKITTIYELWTGDTIREVCEWCTQQYAETAAELLKKRPGLRNANTNRKQREFDKAYAAKFKAEIKTRSAKGEYKFGATLLNKKHEFITIAEGAENPSDVYFALGKYARENCRTLQAVADPRKAGFTGSVRRTG